MAALTKMPKTKKKKAKSEVTLRNAFKSGSLFTKLSAIVMGLGNVLRGQIIKGLIFLAGEIYFIYFMAVSGAGHIKDLITLGTNEGGEVFDETKQIFVYTEGDNSMLCLLYGIITLLIVVAFALFWRAAVCSSYQTDLHIKKGNKVPGIWDDIKALFDVNLHKTLLTLPIVCVVLFTILPLLFMMSMAFTNYDRNHQPPGQLFHWVGLSNFGKLFTGDGGFAYAFWHVLGWTLVWAIFATVLNFIFGTILALVINRKGTKGKKFWRFIFILSIAVPQFVSLLVLRTMLQPEGAVNVLLKSWGLIDKSLPFWTNPTWARVTIIVVNLWIGIPYTMLQATGILQNIPEELYESAKMDGANAIVTFFKITLPYMMFIMMPYLITQFIGNINNFNVIYLLTKGTPASMAYHNGTAGKTDLLVTWLYKLTIDMRDYNLGAVIGIMVFVLSAVFSILAYRRTSSYKDEEAFQ